MQEYFKAALAVESEADNKAWMEKAQKSAKNVAAPFKQDWQQIVFKS